MKFWLAVSTAVNCDILTQMGRPFYALSGAGTRYAHSAQPGDKCVLYRAKGGQGGSGFIGVYEVADTAVDEPIRFPGSLRAFGTRLPWRPLITCEENPVNINPLVADLAFIANKHNYGMSLRTNLQRLSEQDFALISGRIKENAAKVSTGAR